MKLIADVPQEIIGELTQLANEISYWIHENENYKGWVFLVPPDVKDGDWQDEVTTLATDKGQYVVVWDDEAHAHEHMPLKKALVDENIVARVIVEDGVVEIRE